MISYWCPKLMPVYFQLLRYVSLTPVLSGAGLETSTVYKDSGKMAALRVAVFA